MIQINELIKDAMHQKDMFRLNVLKLIKAEFLKKSTEPGRNSKELTDEEQINVLMKMSAQRKDSIGQYKLGGRADLAESEEKELEIISSFLPKEATVEELVQYTEEMAETYRLSQGEGYHPSIKDMKNIMSSVKEKYPTANGGVISKAYKDYLSKS